MKLSLMLSAVITAFLMTVAPLSAREPLNTKDPIEKAIKARQSYFQLVSFNAGPLFGMAKGKVGYDAKKAQSLADNLLALTSMTNGAMWPKGSDNVAKKGKTRSLPAIWESGSKIGDSSQAFKDAVKQLASVAGKGADAMKPAVGALGKSCGGCHKPFRAKEF